MGRIVRSAVTSLAILVASQVTAADPDTQRWVPRHPELLHWHPVVIHLPGFLPVVTNQDEPDHAEPDNTVPDRQPMFSKRRPRVMFAPRRAAPVPSWSHIMTDETKRQIAEAMRRK